MDSCELWVCQQNFQEVEMYHLIVVVGKPSKILVMTKDTKQPSITKKCQELRIIS